MRGVLAVVLLSLGVPALAQRLPSRPPAQEASPLARGVALLNQGRAAEAVPLLEAAVRADSLHEAPFAALALAYLQAGRPRSAEAVAVRGLRRFPASLDLGRVHAEALVGREAFADALAVYRRLERRGGTALQARIGALERALGVRAAQAGRLGEATAHLERARSALPDSAGVVRELAALYLQREAWAEARRVAEAGLARFRGDGFLMRARALALTSLDDPDARLDALEQLFRRDTTDVTVGLALADARVAARRPQDAWTLLLRLGDGHPADRRVFEAQAALASAALNPAAALGALRRVRRLAPDDDAVLVRIGEAYEGLRDWDAARAAYDSAAVRTGEVYAGHLRVARTYVRQDTLQPALVHYRDLVYTSPDSVALLREAAAVYEIAGRWTDARRTYERIVRTHPADRWRLGRALDYGGEPLAAQATYRQALAEGAPHPFALWRLALRDPTGQACRLAVQGLRLTFAPPSASREEGVLAEFRARADSAETVTRHLLGLLPGRCEPAEARLVFEELTRRAPLAVEVRLAQSQFEATAGDTTAALAVLEAAARVAPRDADVQVALGALYEAAGHLVEARGAYERALTLMPTVLARYQDLSRVMHRLGLLEGLLTRWRARLRTTPADEVLREALARALTLGGDAQEARAVREGQ